MKVIGVTVDGYSERWLRRGFPWVYPKEVPKKPQARPGDEVLLKAGNGDVLGRGLWDAGWLSARVYRHDGGPLDGAWLDAALDAALALRKEVVDEETTGYRLVNAENDGLPGIRVDRWGDRVVLSLDSPACLPLVDGIVDWLGRTLRPVGVHRCWRPDPRETIDFSKAPKAGLVAGDPGGETVVTERGLRFVVRADEGPDVGLYADMRETRRWLEPAWRGRRVLNTFAYTGAFSVAAKAHGAAEVVTVDLSEKYLERARANFDANDLDPGELVAEDTFKALDRFRRKDRTFDVVVVDPPSFSHGPQGTWSAEQDYPRLVAAACRVLAPGGWLVAATNLGTLSPHEWNGKVDDGFRRAGRRGQELWWGRQSPDFPAATWFPEGKYLKVAVWKVT